MKPTVDFLMFKVVKLSGLIWLGGVLLTGLATGQAEISYHFWFLGNVASLMAVIAARIEGRIHHDAGSSPEH